MLLYKSIVHQLKGGYQKGWRDGWMRDEVGIRCKSAHIKIEERDRLYS